MKNLFSMLLLCAAVVLASCSKSEPTPDPVSVAFSSLTANGSKVETTTVLSLTFDKAIVGLSAADITLTAGETGAIKGALTDKTNGVYELAVSGVAKGGEVTVAVAKAGYVITPASNKVMLTYYLAPLAVGNFYYDDNTYSSTLDASKTCIGIVFEVNHDGVSGRILGLKSAENKKWGPRNLLETVEGITSTTDGATATKNLIMAHKDEPDFASNYSAFDWVYIAVNGGDINGRWYIPSKEEWQALYRALNGNLTVTATAHTSFNAQLIAASSEAIFSSSYYWTATQDGANHARLIAGSDGYVNSGLKTTGYGVRVVSAF